MNWQFIHLILVTIQHTVSVIGILIIVTGVLYSLFLYVRFLVLGEMATQGEVINTIRLTLGRVLILGLEFIVAADLIGSTTTPDYYSVGLLAIIVLVRTVLSFSLSRELMMIGKE